MNLGTINPAPSGFFQGYASIFYAPDKSNDIIMPGAFRKSILERGARGIRMLYQHNPAQPVGVWKTIREDSRGLRVEGALLLNIARAHDVHKLLKAGALDGLSIGFHTVKAGTDRRTGRRIVREIDLIEISIVTFPMHPQARMRALGASQNDPRGSKLKPQQNHRRLLI